MPIDAGANIRLSPELQYIIRLSHHAATWFRLQYSNTLVVPMTTLECSFHARLKVFLASG